MARFITLTTEVKLVKHSWYEVDFPTRSRTFNSNVAAEDQNCFRPNASRPSWLQIRGSVRHLWSLSKQQAHRVYGSKLHSTAMTTKTIYYPKVTIIVYDVSRECQSLAELLLELQVKLNMILI